MAITSWPRFKLLGIAERRRRQRHRFVDAQQREVGVGIIADQPRAQILAVGGGHLDAEPAPAEPATWLLVRMRPSGATTTPEPVRPVPFGAERSPLRARGKTDHGRPDAVDHVDDGARIGVEQRLVLGRDRRPL